MPSLRLPPGEYHSPLVGQAALIVHEATKRLKKVGMVQIRYEGTHVEDLPGMGVCGEVTFQLEIISTRERRRGSILVDVPVENGVPKVPLYFRDLLGRRWSLNERALRNLWDG